MGAKVAENQGRGSGLPANAQNDRFARKPCYAWYAWTGDPEASTAVQAGLTISRCGADVYTAATLTASFDGRPITPYRATQLIWFMALPWRGFW